jgi:transposase
VLHTGIAWEHLPQELGYGSGMTCWRRLAEGNASGVWQRLREVLLDRLRAADALDLLRAAVDSSQVRALKGGRRLARPRSIEGGPAASTI